MDNFWVAALWSITPTVLVGLLFWWILRVIVRSDRRERAAYEEMDLQERERANAEHIREPRSDLG